MSKSALSAGAAAIQRVCADVAELVDATDLDERFECSPGNRRCRTAQSRGNLNRQSRAKPSDGKV
jgi:hypothetical protein